MKRRMVPRGSGELAMLAAMLLVALVSGSVALLGEILRSTLLTAALMWAIMVRVTATRDAGQRYPFGVGKLEQAGNACIGLALAAAGLWVAGLAFHLVMAGESEAGPLGFALAATAGAVHTVRRSFLLWPHATFRAAKQGPTHGDRRLAFRASSRC